MTGKIKTMSVQSFALGMNNRAPDFKLRTEDGYFLRDAVNVDVTQEGSLKRRRGAARVLPMTSGHSLWSGEDGAYACDGTTLYELVADAAGGLNTTVVTTVQPGRSVAFEAAPGGGVFWTDGIRLERIVDGLSSPLNPSPPTVAPLISVGAGLLRAGRYNIVFTTVADDGRESAPTAVQQVEVPDGSALSFTLPVSPAATEAIAVYVGGVGGVVPYYVGEFVAAGTLSADQLPVGRACPTYGLAPMPAGQLLCHQNGRLFVASGSVLYMSEPFAPGLYKAESGYILFGADIAVLEAMQGQASGIYVVADETYWFGGDASSAQMLSVLPYGAMQGSSYRRRDQTLVHWMSPRGLIQAGPGGAVKNLQEDRVAIAPTARAAVMVRETNGMQQAVAALYGAATGQQATASSYMDVEMIHGE